MSIKRLCILALIFCMAPLLSKGQDVKDSVEIFFQKDIDSLQLNHKNNGTRLDSMIHLMYRRIADFDISLKKLEITGRTSPEGVPSFNRMLSERRAAVLADYSENLWKNYLPDG